MKNIAWAVVLRFLFFIAIILLFAYISYGQELENYKFPNDYRGVIHLHSKLSHDSNGKFEDIMLAAMKNDIDFVVLTDHWSLDLYKKSQRKIFFSKTIYIIGAEIGKNEGVTLLTFPLPQDFVPENDWRKNVALLRENGSLALASHIEFSDTGQLVGVDGIEITNLHTMLVDRTYPGFFWAWIRALWWKNWDLAYLFNSEILKNLPRWKYLGQSINLPAFAGNDTHDNYRLFYKLGPKLGSYDNTFKLITTHIWANELSEKSIIEAIKNGQSYFAFEIFGSTKGFRFYATFQQAQDKQSGTKIFLPGSTVLQNKKITLTIQSPPHENPSKTEIKILRDGKVLKTDSGILLNFETNQLGNYYAEIWKDGKPWIFGNPIQIRPD